MGKAKQNWPGAELHMSAYVPQTATTSWSVSSDGDGDLEKSALAQCEVGNFSYLSFLFPELPVYCQSWLYCSGRIPGTFFFSGYGGPDCSCGIKSEAIWWHTLTSSKFCLALYSRIKTEQEHIRFNLISLLTNWKMQKRFHMNHSFSSVRFAFVSCQKVPKFIVVYFRDKVVRHIFLFRQKFMFCTNCIKNANNLLL